MLDRIAAEERRFQDATDEAYEPRSFGWEVGGALEQATPKTLTEQMQGYLVQPLMLNGAYFSVPTNELARVALPIFIAKVAKSQSQPAKNTGSRKPNLRERALIWSGQDPQDFQDAMIPKG